MPSPIPTMTPEEIAAFERACAAGAAGSAPVRIARAPRASRDPFLPEQSAPPKPLPPPKRHLIDMGSPRLVADGLRRVNERTAEIVAWRRR